MVKKGKLSFFLHCAQCFTYLSFLFSSSSIIFLIFLPQFFYSLLHNFIIFSPPPPPHLLYIFFHPQKKSTSCRPYNDPRLNFVFQHSCVNSETIYNHHHISIVFSPLTHFCCFYSTITFLLFPSSSTTFLLFSSIDLLFAFGLFGLWLPLLACVWPVTF